MSFFFDQDYDAYYTMPPEAPQVNDEVGSTYGFGADYSFGHAPVALYGTTNQLPLVSSVLQSSSTGDSPFKVATNLLGAIRGTVRDVGTVVGTVQRDLSGVDKIYNTAMSNARDGNKIGQFWQYSTGMEKIMLGLGVVAVLLVLAKD